MGLQGPVRAAHSDARIRVAHPTPQDPPAKRLHGQHVPGIPAGPRPKLQHQAGEQAGGAYPRNKRVTSDERRRTKDEGRRKMYSSSFVFRFSSHYMEPTATTRVSISGALLHPEVAR